MKYAGFIKRTAAFFLDLLILLILFLFLKWGIGFNLQSYLQIGNISPFYFFIFIYFFVFAIINQETLGKRFFGLKEVDKEGNKISTKNRLLRFLFIIILIIGTQLPNLFPSGRYSEQCGYILESKKYLYLLPIQILCIIIYMSLIFSRTKQNLYDKLTKTFVTENKKRTILFALIILLIGLFLMSPLTLKDLLISMEPKTMCISSEPSYI